MHGEAIRSVGGDRQHQNLVIQPQAWSHRCAQGGHLLQQLIKNGDSFPLCRLAKLGKGADHAAAGHTAQFGWLDRQVDRRQSGAHQGNGHMDASPYIRCPADDLQGFGGADIY